MIRIKLEIAKKYRDLLIFNLAIDSKFRIYDLVKLKVAEVSHVYKLRLDLKVTDFSQVSVSLDLR